MSGCFLKDDVDKCSIDSISVVTAAISEKKKYINREHRDINKKPDDSSTW
jgi:hypothetical protein